jgi:hypothetical protein
MSRDEVKFHEKSTDFDAVFGEMVVKYKLNIIKKN